MTNIDKHIFAFDIDGVLTNPHEKRVVHQGIIKWLATTISKDTPVGLLTGRNYEFAEDEIVNRIVSELTDKALISKLFVIGEKGGVWATYDESETRKLTISKKFNVPNSVRDQIKAIINESYADSMFWDSTKRCMATIEFKDEKMGGKVPFEEYKILQQDLITKLEELIQNEGRDNLNVDPTTIATDIQDVRLGKDLAAETFLNLISEQGYRPKSVTCFGDSPSDYAMHEMFEKHGLNSNFVYVGNDDKFNEDSDVTNTKNEVGKRYDDGTLWYLESFLA